MNPAHPPPYGVIALIAGLLALAALWGFWRRVRRDRLIADTPAARLRSAAQGYVKVSGRAMPSGAAPLAAPLTSRPCVWWAFEIAHRERDARGNSHWHTIDSGTSVELFALLDEDNSRCLIGPVSAEVTPSSHNTWYGESETPDGLPPGGGFLLHSGDYRYSERLLEAGERVCVLGELRSHSELPDALAAGAAKLHAWKQDQGTLLARFDADHDGRLNEAEWEAARAAAAAEARAESLQAPIARESVIAAPANGEPFLIAPLSATALERRERHMAILYFAFGLACVLTCAWAARHAALFALAH